MGEPAEPAPVHETRIRVRYLEVDRMGYLWHGHYVAYFEQARTEWLRARGATYRELEDAGVLLVVVETGVRFERPGAYDDELSVRAELAEARGARLRFQYEVWRDDVRLATGFTVLASADRTGRPRRLPPTLVALAEAAGKPEPAAGVEDGPGGGRV